MHQRRHVSSELRDFRIKAKEGYILHKDYALLEHWYNHHSDEKESAKAIAYLENFIRIEPAICAGKTSMEILNFIKRERVLHLVKAAYECKQLTVISAFDD